MSKKATLLWLLSLTLFAAMLSCAGASAHRTQRLLALASGEIRFIKAPLERITRQLNLANIQIEDGHDEDGMVTLRDARETLGSAGEDDFTDHTKMAGWISLVELSHQAKDLGFAEDALEKALAELNEIEPEYNRIRYVRGVADQVGLLLGKEERADLLVKGGSWAKGIENPYQRRQVLLSYVDDLFAREYYHRGLEVLRNDGDAAWRADTLLAMSGQEKSDGGGGVPVDQMRGIGDYRQQAAEPSGARRRNEFEADLSFKTNYYRP